MNVYSEMRNKAKRQKTNHHQDSIIIGLLLPGVVLMLLAFMLLLYTISPHAGRSRTFYFRYALNVRNCAEFIRLDNFKLLVRAFASGCVPFSKELFFSSFSVFAFYVLTRDVVQGSLALTRSFSSFRTVAPNQGTTY